MDKVKESVKQTLLGGGNKGNEAAWIDGKDAKLRVDKAEMPVAGPDEIVVKNHAVAINPVDWIIQDHGMFVTTWPNILGCDIAGEVHEVGSNVTRFKKGDRVFGHAMSLYTQKPKHGGFALYTAVDQARAAVIPQNVSFAKGSVMPLALNTAAMGLYGPTDKGFLGLPQPSLTPSNSNKVIVVWGGASSVGALAIQLAVGSGVKVIATASSRNHSLVKSWGATEVFDYSSKTVAEDIIKAVQASGGEFAGVYDAISKDYSYEHVLPIVEKLGGGNIAIVLGPPEKDVPGNVKLGAVFAPADMYHSIWENYATPALEQGRLKAAPEPMVVGKGLDRLQEAMEIHKKGVSAKKVVVEL